MGVDTTSVHLEHTSPKYDTCNIIIIINVYKWFQCHGLKLLDLRVYIISKKFHMHVLYSYVCITSFAFKDYETYTEIVYSFMLTYITCTIKHQNF